MHITRLDVEQVARLGGPAGAAARVRSLVPGGDSVEDEVREILRRVRSEGKTAP